MAGSPYRQLTSTGTVSMSSSHTFVDMFAGLGGFHVGLEKLGMQCVFACEKDAELAELYKNNFGKPPGKTLYKRGDICYNIKLSRLVPLIFLCGGVA